MSSPRLGLTFVPTLPPERLRDVAAAAEAAGLDELWLWEDCFKEGGLATAAVALAWTERIRVCIGLLPVPLRNVALVAMEIATLDRLFPGRFVVGIGHGVQDWMGQVGARVESPMTLLREYTGALRRLLAGEEVSVQGRYVRLDRVRLDWPPAQPPPLMIGGAGPKSLALAAELGDATMLSAVLSARSVQEACGMVVAASPATAPEVVTTLIAATGPGAGERADAEVRRWGGEVGAGASVAGDPAGIADAVRRLAAVGVTSVAIQPTEDEPDLPGLIGVLGEVRGLL
jgi:alkanesulfonate monooxygenase SsuD/methylene tetrahydromethanopterin reductase-like flavin-dependent oxidoreductase (luciferase family)